MIAKEAAAKSASPSAGHAPLDGLASSDGKAPHNLHRQISRPMDRNVSGMGCDVRSTGPDIRAHW